MTPKAKKRTPRRAAAPAAARRTTPPRPRPVVAPRRREAPSRLSRLGLAESPRRVYAGALAVAVLLGSLLIGLSVISANRSTTAANDKGGSVPVTGIAENAALLHGIPQHGSLLGSPTAPIQLVEYADPQCPYCAQYARDVLPPLVQEYVRTGQVQMVFRGIWFLGADSETALRTAAAAASENKLWNVLDLLYRNQGAENAWVNDQLLRSIVTAAGADSTRVFAARDGAAVNTMVNRWGSLAQADGINAVPAFFLGPRGGPLQRLQVTTIAAPEFRAALDSALKR